MQYGWSRGGAASLSRGAFAAYGGHWGGYGVGPGVMTRPEDDESGGGSTLFKKPTALVPGRNGRVTLPTGATIEVPIASPPPTTSAFDTGTGGSADNGFQPASTPLYKRPGVWVAGLALLGLAAAGAAYARSR